MEPDSVTPPDADPNATEGPDLLPGTRARLGSLVDRLARLEPAAIVLVGAIAVWVGVFGILAWRRHAWFASFGFDMGIFDQAIWLAARGGSFITVRGLDLFGHHANVGFYLLAPLSWLGAGPHTWNLLQVGLLGLGAVPLYLLGRDRGLTPWVALAPAAAFLLHPSLGFLAWELFHPETVAVTFLLFAYLAATRNRWRWYAVLLVVAVAWKEDVALFAFVLGLLLFVRGHRRAGAWTMVVSALWFVFVTRFLLGAVNGEGAFYEQFYGDLGNSPVEILTNVVSNPTEIGERFGAGDARSYLWQLAAPWLFLGLAAPLVLLAGVPQLVANVLSINDFTRDITFHYAALPLAALALAGVEGLARLGTTEVRQRALAAALVLVALASAVQWGVSPIGDEYDRGYWPSASDPRRPAKQAAVEAIPSGAPVAATYGFVPHLSRRQKIYEFPNPFRERNWGVRGEHTHDPDDVEWLAVDRTQMGPEDTALFERVVAGPWAVVLERDGVVVARRTAPDPSRASG